MTDPNRVTVTYNGIPLEGVRDAGVELIEIDTEFLPAVKAFLYRKRKFSFTVRGKRNGLRTAWAEHWERLVAELQFQRDVRSALLSDLQTSVPERNYYREYATHSRPSDVAKLPDLDPGWHRIFIEPDRSMTIPFNPRPPMDKRLADAYRRLEDLMTERVKGGTYLQARNS